jgi:hypothetical protein
VVRWIAISLMVLALVVALAVAVLVARVISQAAKRRGRSRRVFFWVSFVFFPIGALICWLIVLGSERPHPKT